MGQPMDLQNEKNFFETSVIEYQCDGAPNWDLALLRSRQWSRTAALTLPHKTLTAYPGGRNPGELSQRSISAAVSA